MRRSAPVRSSAALLGAIALVCVSLSLAAVDTSLQSPDGLVRAVTGEMLNALRSDREAIVNDRQRLVSLMQRIIVPHFDTRVMARAALGKYWRRASADQRNRFGATFRQLLVDDYAAVFRKYSNQSVDVLPVQSLPRADTVVVPTYVTTPGEPRIRVDYRLHRVGGEWRIHDVAIDGISLLLNYRNSFFEELQHESLDDLIAGMNHKNAAFRQPVHE
jgi:phospholipid transport system substrate-binding protein